MFANSFVQTFHPDRPNSDAYRRSLASPQDKQKRSASVIVRRNSFMQLLEFTRSTTLRWTFFVTGLFAAFIVALLGFFYLKTEGGLTMRSDPVIVSQMGVHQHVAIRQTSPDQPSASPDCERSCSGLKAGRPRR